LWQGKPIKSAGIDVFGIPTDELNGRVFSTDDQGNFIWTASKRNSIDQNLERRPDAAYEQQSAEGRSGLGRLRDAVGIKSHHPRQIKEEDEPQKSLNDAEISSSRKYFDDQKPTPDHVLRRADTYDRKATDKYPLNLALATPGDTSKLNREDSRRQSNDDIRSLPNAQNRRSNSPRSKTRQGMSDIRMELEDDVYQHFSSAFRYEGPRARRLKRSQSAIHVLDIPFDNQRQARIPRNLSFSIVESTVLSYVDVVTELMTENEDKIKQPAVAIITQDLAAIAAQKKARQIMYLQHARVPYVQNLVDNVESLDREAAEHLDELNTLYYERLEEYQALRTTSTDVVDREKTALTESLRRVELLGSKLDYELAALQSRVQEVEDGVKEFERNVLNIEARLKELTTEESAGKTSWFYHVIRFFSSIR